MELLLNLSWLLLALPAYWLWRDCRRTPAERGFSAIRCVLALGCMLVMLFPVVSASDDLRAMRAELEESPTSKRSICQSSGDKPSVSKAQTQPALALASYSFAIHDQGWHGLAVVLFQAPKTTTLASAGRAPPQYFL